MRIWVWSLASFSVLRIQHCHKLRCSLQISLGSDMAVAQAGSCSSDSTPSPGTSICCSCGPKKKKIYISSFYSCSNFKIKWQNSHISEILLLMVMVRYESSVKPYPKRMFLFAFEETVLYLWPSHPTPQKIFKDKPRCYYQVPHTTYTIEVSNINFNLC